MGVRAQQLKQDTSPAIGTKTHVTTLTHVLRNRGNASGKGAFTLKSWQRNRNCTNVVGNSPLHVTEFIGTNLRGDVMEHQLNLIIIRQFVKIGNGIVQNMNQINREGAVTVVELLIVTAIIIVLASIVFVAVGGVKNQTAFISCQSNLSQLGKAMNLYANDHDGYCPPIRTDDAILNISGTETPVVVKGDQKRWVNLHNLYLKETRIFFCKADTKAGLSTPFQTIDGSRSNEFTSYASGAPIDWTVLSSGVAFVNLNVVDKKVPYATDVVAKHLDASKKPPIFTSHGNWITELYFDGSARKVKLTD
jgi:type II secretory pathway pseudopilin PulG